jgi:hypothetical protein
MTRRAERSLVGPLRGYQVLRANAGLVITTEAMVAELQRRTPRPAVTTLTASAA